MPQLESLPPAGRAWFHQSVAGLVMLHDNQLTYWKDVAVHIDRYRAAAKASNAIAQEQQQQQQQQQAPVQKQAPPRANPQPQPVPPAKPTDGRKGLIGKIFGGGKKESHEKDVPAPAPAVNDSTRDSDLHSAQLERPRGPRRQANSPRKSLTSPTQFGGPTEPARQEPAVEKPRKENPAKAAMTAMAAEAAAVRNAVREARETAAREVQDAATAADDGHQDDLSSASETEDHEERLPNAGTATAVRPKIRSTQSMEARSAGNLDSDVDDDEQQATQATKRLPSNTTSTANQPVPPKVFPKGPSTPPPPPSDDEDEVAAKLDSDDDAEVVVVVEADTPMRKASPPPKPERHIGYDNDGGSSSQLSSRPSTKRVTSPPESDPDDDDDAVPAAPEQRAPSPEPDNESDDEAAPQKRSTRTSSGSDAAAAKPSPGPSKASPAGPKPPPPKTSEPAKPAPPPADPKSSGPPATSNDKPKPPAPTTSNAAHKPSPPSPFGDAPPKAKLNQASSDAAAKPPPPDGDPTVRAKTPPPPRPPSGKPPKANSKENFEMEQAAGGASVSANEDDVQDLRASRPPPPASKPGASRHPKEKLAEAVRDDESKMDATQPAPKRVVQNMGVSPVGPRLGKPKEFLSASAQDAQTSAGAPAVSRGIALPIPKSVPQTPPADIPNQCSECDCNDFVVNPFKPGGCNNCFHKHQQ